jgi:hypothetical protein
MAEAEMAENEIEERAAPMEEVEEAPQAEIDAGARVDFAFNGTSVTWMGYRDEWSGLAQVFMDGALQTTVRP